MHTPDTCRALGCASLPESERRWHYVKLGDARRVHMREARAVFLEGGEILVSEHGHLETMPVTNMSTTHTGPHGWDSLADMVTMWRNRYPNQRFYIVTRDRGQS